MLAVLAGCQTTGDAGPNGPAVGGVGEASAPTGAPAGGASAAVVAIRFDAGEFLGFSPERVLPVLGAPDFVRRDGNAQIWQYRATNCVLDLFLYKTGRDTAVKHAELRPRVPAAEPLDVCYSKLRRDRNANPSG